MATKAKKIPTSSRAIDVFQQSEQLFRVLIEHSADAIALLSAEGIFLYVSPSASRVFGYTSEELLGQNGFDYVPKENLAFVAGQFEDALRTPGKTKTIEHQFLHKNGSILWLESTITNFLNTPDIHAIVSNFRDIAERKQEEERRRLLDEASRMLVSSLDHQITLQEIAQMIVPSLADYCRIVIIDEQHQIKEITVNHIDPEQLALVQALYEQYKDRIATTHGLQRLLERGKPELISNISEGVLETVQDNPEMLAIIQALGLQSYMGTPLIFHDRLIGAITFSSIQPHRHYTQNDLLFAQELAHRIALVLENARLHREAQEEIAERKRTEAQLRQSEERKDEFISMASHELKTPVTSLKGFTNLLQRRLAKQGDEQALHYLARMDSQLNKLTRLITELLDVSRIQAGKLTSHREIVALDALLEETVENLQATTSTHTLHFEGTAEALVFGDRDRLGQVLINLISNAIKYSPKADTVIVRLLREPEHIRVSVQDFGIGIAEIHQGKIFERFYQVTDPEEKTYPGLGVGLYISCEIIKQHSGRLWVESKKGEGATFHFTLPLHKEG